MNNETVGSLLAVIANSINDAIRVMTFADKRGWGPDEHEQLRLLEETLDEAKRDFQEMPSWINGTQYYENDRKTESLEDLRILCNSLELHAQTFKDWAKMGGPINPVWARETISLRRKLHRAQCRAARRIFTTEREESQPRCLGAYQIYRVQRSPRHIQQRQLEELMTCKQIGHFERLGERDIAFVCDFCDGHIVWEDLREMPNRRKPPPPGLEPQSATSPTSSMPAIQADWQATGFKRSNGDETTIVFPAVAIANHMAPETGEWESRILCPYCDEYYTYEQGDDEMEGIKWNQDEHGFEDLNAFREHLEWNHTTSTVTPSTDGCSLM